MVGDKRRKYNILLLESQLTVVVVFFVQNPVSNFLASTKEFKTQHTCTI